MGQIHFIHCECGLNTQVTIQANTRHTFCLWALHSHNKGLLRHHVVQCLSALVMQLSHSQPINHLWTGCLHWFKALIFHIYVIYWKYDQLQVFTSTLLRKHDKHLSILFWTAKFASQRYAVGYRYRDCIHPLELKTSNLLINQSQSGRELKAEGKTGLSHRQTSLCLIVFTPLLE